MLTMTNNDIPLNIYTQTFCVSLAPQVASASEYKCYIIIILENYSIYNVIFILIIIVELK